MLTEPQSLPILAASTNNNKARQTMKMPKTDNDCTELGWREYLVYMGEYELHVSICPCCDLDGTFRAFCHDEQELLNINGWLVTEFMAL